MINFNHIRSDRYFLNVDTYIPALKIITSENLLQIVKEGSRLSGHKITTKRTKWEKLSPFNWPKTETKYLGINGR